MDFHELLKHYSPILKQHWLPILLASVGLIFFAYGLISLSGKSSESNRIIFEEENNQIDEKKAKITVDVEGGVVKPGVYELEENARMKDALIAAGGLSDQAERSWVSKNFNLAAKVTDGVKIYIPLIGEKAELLTTADNLSISINSASEKELDSLPGVGPATAQKIIAARPYNSIEELLEKKAVSSKVFEQIKEKITF